MPKRMRLRRGDEARLADIPGREVRPARASSKGTDQYRGGRRVGWDIRCPVVGAQ